MDMLDGYAATEHAVEEAELCKGTFIITMQFNFTRIVIVIWALVREIARVQSL